MRLVVRWSRWIVLLHALCLDFCIFLTRFLESWCKNLFLLSAFPSDITGMCSAINTSMTLFDEFFTSVLSLISSAFYHCSPLASTWIPAPPHYYIKNKKKPLIHRISVSVFQRSFHWEPRFQRGNVITVYRRRKKLWRFSGNKRITSAHRKLSF